MPKKQQEQRSFWAEFGKSLVPRRFRPDLRSYLSKAGYSEVPYLFFALLFFLGIGITAAIFFLSGFAGMLSNYGPGLQFIFVFLFWAIVALIVVSVIMAGFYFYTNMQIYKRIKEIENQLPEYLILVSTNLKGGMSFEKSLWGAIKPEFKMLAEEMSIVSKKVMTGEDITDSLQQLADKYDSPTMKRNINIIIGEIEAGGEIAHVLDSIISNLRKTKILKDEMSANTLMFTIFIAAIVVVISPLLFALAKVLLSVLIDVSKQVAPAVANAPSSAAGSFKIKEISLSIDDFRNFSVGALTIITTCASLILSIIQKGDIKAGIKYLPFFLAASLAFYFLFAGVLGSFFTIGI